MSQNNFFEPYLDKAEPINYDRVVFIVLFALIFVAIVMSYLLIQGKITAVAHDITRLDKQIHSEEMQAELTEIDRMATTIGTLKQSADKLNFLHVIETLDRKFDHSTFMRINQQVPSSAFITAMAVTNKHMSIDGYAKDVDSVALLTYQLAKLDQLHEVKVINLVDENNQFNFLIEAMLVPVNLDVEQVVDEGETDD